MRRSADDWFIVDHPANCCPSGPGFPTTPVCCVPHATQQGERLQSAGTPDVPFCDAARVATAVVLARRSAVGWRREIADYALLNDTARAVILCAREPNALGHP